MPLRPILKNLPSYEYLGDDLTQEPKLSPTYINSSPLPFACLSHIPPADSHHVHFPPTPTLTRIEMTHSSLSYDRKPISISPNLCALPGRGERTLDCFNARQPHKPRSFEFEDGYASSSTTGFQFRKPFGRRRCLSTNSRIGMRVTSSSMPNCANTASNSPEYTINHSEYRESSREAETKFCSTQWHAPPALFFDPSSGSESEACISPPTDLSLPHSISNISTYRRDWGLLAASGQNETKHTSLFYQEHNLTLSPSATHMALNLGEQLIRRYRQQEKNWKPTSCKLVEGKNSEAISLSNITTCPIKRKGARNRPSINIPDARAGFESSSFLEPGLDGCLGGF